MFTCTAFHSKCILQLTVKSEQTKRVNHKQIEYQDVYIKTNIILLVK